MAEVYLKNASTRDFAAEEWDRLCARDPASLAVAEIDREITVGDLIHKARMRAGQFIAQGAEPGSRVIIARPNVIEFVIDYLAVRLCGAVLVNLPWSAGTSITELADILDAKVVVLTEHLVGDNPLFDQLGARRFRENEAAPIGPERPIRCLGDELAWLACTSGTTGTPKAAMHTGATWQRQTEMFATHFGLTKDDPILVSSPVGHAVSLLFGVRFSLLLNSPMVLVSRWNIDTAVTLIDRYKCTFTVAPTPFLIDMVAYAEKHGNQRIKTLKFFPSAGAPVPRTLVRRALEAMPGCQVWSYFGTSEAGAVTAVPLDADLDKRLDTDGIATPGTKTRVIDGELQIHSPEQMMKGYWSGDPKGRLHADGWYQTGDACEQREDGYIKMVGRAQDIILRGGENISPLEIENALLSHSAVEDVAIIGYPDDRLGSRLAAVVVKAGEVTLTDLRNHCQGIGLDKAKWPEFLTCIDKIPLSAIGKVQRGVLEDHVWNLIKSKRAESAS
ncbi:class I adenylate-forming enzyme family protein [Pararhodobacter sp.]|uniref:class I adenylate-forming enzyme family protein n=1 Tax=Pararhodobacter sp. TaxID=2127056 RepID=UPI002AFFF779|nr:AMP-binding protein [Pararhodobacter sp.]